MITEINVDETDKWNRIVRSFSTYDVFYLNEYVAAFEKFAAKNGEPVLLYYNGNSETDRAINVMFKRDIGRDPNLSDKIEVGEFYDLTSPYGYGGWWGQVSNYEKLNQEHNEYCKRNHYICEFVRFELFSDYHEHYDGIVETHTHNVVRSLNASIEDLWMDFKQKVRKNVKKARTNELSIIVDEGKHINDHLGDFLRIYYSTMDRTNAAKDYYFDEAFYRKINSMVENAVYFYTSYQGKIISTELVIYGAENAYSYLGGTDRNYFDVRPNDFLKFEIIKWCKEKGLKNFVFGGGYGSDDGIFQYKTSFAPNGIVNFYIGKKIFNKEKYLELCSLRGLNANIEASYEGYFPRYRAN